MKNRRINTNINKYLRTAVLGLIAAIAASLFAGLLTADSAAMAIRAVCDGLFISAILLIGGGLLALSSGEGIFDMIKYGTSLVINVMSLGEFRKRYPSYLDYKQNIRSKKTEWLHITAVGAGYLAAAFIALGLYYLAAA